MAIKVAVKGQPPDIMEIVRDLRAQGYVQGKDFDFSYHQREWDPETLAASAAYASFVFYEEKYGTMFALKHSDNIL